MSSGGSRNGGTLGAAMARGGRVGRKGRGPKPMVVPRQVPMEPTSALTPPSQPETAIPGLNNYARGGKVRKTRFSRKMLEQMAEAKEDPREEATETPAQEAAEKD